MILGGGNSFIFFDVHPEKIGEDEPTHFDDIIFFKMGWFNQPPTSKTLHSGKLT